MKEMLSETGKAYSFFQSKFCLYIVPNYATFLIVNKGNDDFQVTVFLTLNVI